MLTLVLLLALQPHYVVASAVLTRHALLVSPFPEPPAAGRFVRKILVKLENLHITFYFINAEAKVIILIYFTKLFPDYFHPSAKKTAYPSG
jgi:hypothetical protein